MDYWTIWSPKISTHLIIPDAHATPDQENGRFSWLGELIADIRPDVVINIGDWYDLSSLCSYDKGTKSFEGRRLRSDLDAGYDALERVMQPIRRAKKKLPRFVSLEGNHEYRLTKAINNNPTELHQMIDTDAFRFDDFGWEYHPYNGATPATLFIDNVLYAHYITKPGSDRATSTEHHAYNLIYETMSNVVVGHKHSLDWAYRTKVDGTPIQGICAGCYMDYQPSYAGESAKHWWSGVVVLENLAPDTGYFEPRFITLKSIKEEYS